MNNVFITGNKIVDVTFLFALDIILFCELLEENKKFAIARQLLRSDTSIGANIKEAQNCGSRADFIHKFKIAAKEADETEYLLLLCKHSESYPFHENLLIQVKEIQKIINKIIYTSNKINYSICHYSY